MKLEVKHVFPTSSSGVIFFIYQLSEGLGMRRILAHGIRMQRKPQSREDNFWIFMELCVSKVQLVPCTEISYIASLTTKSYIKRDHMSLYTWNLRAKEPNDSSKYVLSIAIFMLSSTELERKVINPSLIKI